ncbi:hypothetical protein [Stenotrophomonas humi]
MQQPQRHHYRAIAAQRSNALRPAVLCTLLLLSLLASLWQAGQHVSRVGMVETTASALGEERPGGEKSLEEDPPAKLRRVASPCAPRAPQPYPSLQGHSFTATAVIQQLLIPATPGQLHHTLPSLRQQRGQAPPPA